MSDDAESLRKDVWRELEPLKQAMNACSYPKCQTSVGCRGACWENMCRQRDELQRLLNAAGERIYILEAEVERLTRERDEALALAKLYAEASDALHDAAQAEVERLTRERDEALDANFSLARSVVLGMGKPK